MKELPIADCQVPISKAGTWTTQLAIGNWQLEIKSWKHYSKTFAMGYEG